MHVRTILYTYCSVLPSLHTRVHRRCLALYTTPRVGEFHFVSLSAGQWVLTARYVDPATEGDRPIAAHDTRAWTVHGRAENSFRIQSVRRGRVCRRNRTLLELRAINGQMFPERSMAARGEFFFFCAFRSSTKAKKAISDYAIGIVGTWRSGERKPSLNRLGDFFVNVFFFFSCAVLFVRNENLTGSFEVYHCYVLFFASWPCSFAAVRFTANFSYP